MKRQRPTLDGRRQKRDKPGEQRPADDPLWQHATATIKPLRRVKARVPMVEPPEDSRRGAPAASGSKAPASRLSEASQHAAPAPTSTSKPTATLAPRRSTISTPPPLAAFERRKARRIATGQLEIDARLDLHGARQSEAHGQLRAFLVDCAARGLTTVLIITGKGARMAASRDDASDRPDYGVLRRMVPHWLADPDLRRLVVSHTGAAIKHGGDGALYVHLRRKRPRSD